MQLLSLIKEILDITSIEAGRLVMNPIPVNLPQLIREQCEPMQLQARGAGLSLDLSCHDEVTVRADASRLQQVVRNLVSNAIKFTDRGGVTVRCGVDGSTARVEVEDTGIGIPEDQLPALFTPFQRSSNRLAHNRPGTGLGLATVYGVVRQHDGWVSVESKPGEGTLCRRSLY